MWSAFVFLAGVIFLWKASIDMKREAQARRRQQMRAARRNSANYRRSPDPRRRSAGDTRRQCVRGYGYGTNRCPVSAQPHRRSPVHRVTQPVIAV
ncbi:MAG: hypothetical protein K6E26_07015 [Clostridiales bacterium]|nr:hypothetical protein [Clostridiales bacterium]MCR5275096.1 hypothetical protein [Clostridiales bacterium]